MRRALFIGRFQPFHNSHLINIRSISKKFDEVIIGIGSSQEKNTFENPFSYYERRQMIYNVFKKSTIKNFKIYAIPDFYDDKKWINYIKNRLPRFELAYSGNIWSLKCFKKFNFKFKKINLKKGISGTIIRERIARDKNDKNWKSLVPKEIADYIEKIKGRERIKGIYAMINYEVIS